MKSNFVVPIYIDTNALLDLLASIEGGFSIVEKVTTRTITTAGSDKSISAGAGTEFGIPNVLNLLKIKLGGSLSSKEQRESGEEKEAERYHTYGSLLYRLRTFLDGKELIRRPCEDSEVWKTIEPSDFVEVHGVFRPNPLADSLERIDRLIGLFEIISDFSPPPPGPSSARKKKSSQGDKRQMKQLRQFLQGILRDIEKTNTRIFEIDVTGPNEFSAVVLLFTDYLRDQTMAEISYKEYRLLGKIVRKIEQNSKDTIDLLRGTALGGVGREHLEQLWNAFNQMEQMNLPRVKPEISGPALEVVPIAIFI